ncbi:site-specific integrase [Flavobacterium enshiense]|uniref:tyrosine-type recombinase/integrase n=1 Tax=Flavobacterium enshiense TaxID=1341165 RepID=UPI00345DB145
MKWEAKIILKDGVSRIAVIFEKKAELIDRMKRFEGSTWSQTLQLWHVPDTDANRIRFKLPTKASLLPSEEGMEAMMHFKKHLRSKRYSENTVNTYLDALKSFLIFYNDRPIASISNEDVIHYNNEYILKNKLSASFQNQIVNAIKLFFRIVDDKRIDPELIHRPKRERKLPNVLSKEEVKRIIESPINLKHRTILSLIYACGLRRSEALNLKLTDINSERFLITIRQSKGKKDRIVPVSQKILDMLRDYYKIYKPKYWLFEGNETGTKYSEGSLQCVFKQTLRKCNINKPATLHWLRHSYATHLLECGTDLRYIQELLGHNSSRTTEIYTHVSTKSIQQIRSPFDDL